MPQSNQNPQNEKLYRFHPAYGFVEVTASQQTASKQTTSKQNSSQQDFTQNLGNSNFQDPYNPYAYNPYVNLQYAGMNYSPYPPNNAYCPPNAPYCPYPPHMYHAGMGQGMGYGIPHHMGYHAGMPYQPYPPYAAPYAEQGFSQERIDAIYNTVNDVMNGKAEPTKLFGLFQGTSSDFWKGLAIAAGAIALYNCSHLKDIVASSLAAFFGENMQNNDDGFDNEPTKEKTEENKE